MRPADTLAQGREAFGPQAGDRFGDPRFDCARAAQPRPGSHPHG
jgi:hypothetical protein